MATLTFNLQIEGFKLHVQHNTRPFKNRARQTPEVASKPQRLEHDLSQIKRLASLLEDEAAKLRKFKAVPVPLKEGDGEDAAMSNTEEAQQEEEEEEEPAERGSEAVERRVEKVMADLREQGLIDANDERAHEIKKVSAGGNRSYCHKFLIFGPYSRLACPRLLSHSTCTWPISGRRITHVTTAASSPTIWRSSKESA